MMCQLNLQLFQFTCKHTSTSFIPFQVCSSVLQCSSCETPEDFRSLVQKTRIQSSLFEFIFSCMRLVLFKKVRECHGARCYLAVEIVLGPLGPFSQHLGSKPFGTGAAGIPQWRGANSSRETGRRILGVHVSLNRTLFEHDAATFWCDLKTFFPKQFTVGVLNSLLNRCPALSKWGCPALRMSPIHLSPLTASLACGVRLSACLQFICFPL